MLIDFIVCNFTSCVVPVESWIVDCGLLILSQIVTHFVPIMNYDICGVVIDEIRPQRPCRFRY